MSGGYGTADADESRAALELAFERGVNLFDTADAYGDGANETFVGKVLAPMRSQVHIATKFGYVPGTGYREFDASPTVVRQRCEDSLRRLGVEIIDLYVAHRVDTRVPLEETVGAMATLVDEGKVRYIGVPHTDSDAIRRAHNEHSISFAMTEYSLWARGNEQNMFATLDDLGIGTIAHSPLGRGMLGGSFDRGTLAADDVRRHYPRFQPEQISRHQEVGRHVAELAARLCISPAQLVLSWILAKRSSAVPIPGSRRAAHVEDNVRAVDFELTAADMVVLESFAASSVDSEPVSSS